MKIFLLMLAVSASDADCETATPVWAIEGEADCLAVAEVLNRNSSEGEYAFCAPTYFGEKA